MPIRKRVAFESVDDDCREAKSLCKAASRTVRATPADGEVLTNKEVAYFVAAAAPASCNLFYKRLAQRLAHQKANPSDESWTVPLVHGGSVSFTPGETPTVCFAKGMYRMPMLWRPNASWDAVAYFVRCCIGLDTLLSSPSAA